VALFIDSLVISSPDIQALLPIPRGFSADGGNATPRLEFSGEPAGTIELAVICHDPDAPLPNGFTHWTVYGIPASATRLDLDSAAVRVGPNGAGQASWYGPQPPVGHGPHHYYFWVYALARTVEGAPTREEFLADYSDSIIEQARLVATFER
jgi:Raf kinase inhibitor-like YbhB/YbcL family protein